MKEQDETEEQVPEQMGQFKVTEVLARGGMAVVYKGIQPSLDRAVAIKVLPDELAGKEDLIARFERESSIIAGLNHPNVIQIIDRGVHEGHYYIVMEYVKGCGLDELIRQKKLPIYQIVNVALQVAKAMEYAHSKGVVHRDIKPANVLISSENSTVKVTDFGIAHLSEGRLSSQTLTREQVSMGTLDYMSPEQRRDSRQADARSDIYSFGVLLYEMVTGRIPLGRFRKLHELRDDTPPLLNQVALRCLNEEPRDRYASFTEVITDLNKLAQKELAYREALARMIRSVRQLPKKAKTAISGHGSKIALPKSGRTIKVLSAVAAALVALTILLVGLFPTSEPEEEPEQAFVYQSRFDAAEELQQNKKYDPALYILRDIRKEADRTDNVRDAAEAQWRIARIHQDRGSVKNANIAFTYFVDTYADAYGTVDRERVDWALYRAGRLKADAKDYKNAMDYLKRHAEMFPSSPRAGEVLFRQIVILDDRFKPKKKDIREYREKLAAMCFDFTVRFKDNEHFEEVQWRLAKTYIESGGDENAAKAVETLEEMAKQFPGSGYDPLFEAAEIHRKELSDGKKA